jgi:hypothetical protein
MQRKPLDVVYYPMQVPGSHAALTVLALAFDRIHFPGVYLPKVGFDEDATRAELQRLMKIGARRQEHLELMNIMAFALERRYVDDFCVFADSPDVRIGSQERVHEIATAIEEAIYGPPREGFIPAWAGGFLKKLPDGEFVSAPGWLPYPAHALLYAAEHKLPLVNDDPDMPVPAASSASVRNDAQALSAILTLQCVQMALPTIPVLAPRDLAEFRSDTRALVDPFRLAILELTPQLNAALASTSDPKEIQKAAEFVAESTVKPKVLELRESLARVSGPWYKRAIDLMRITPELLALTFALPKGAGIPAALARVFLELAGQEASALARHDNLTRSGMYYLLRISEDVGATRTASA